MKMPLFLTTGGAVEFFPLPWKIATEPVYSGSFGKSGCEQLKLTLLVVVLARYCWIRSCWAHLSSLGNGEVWTHCAWESFTIMWMMTQPLWILHIYLKLLTSPGEWSCYAMWQYEDVLSEQFPGINTSLCKMEENLIFLQRYLEYALTLGRLKINLQISNDNGNFLMK